MFVLGIVVPGCTVLIRALLLPAAGVDDIGAPTLVCQGEGSEMYFGAREVVGELLHKNRRDLPWPISLVSIENKGVGLQAIWVSGWDSQWKPSKYFLAS
jgi:hypothetical protein